MFDDLINQLLNEEPFVRVYVVFAAFVTVFIAGIILGRLL